MSFLNHPDDDQKNNASPCEDFELVVSNETVICVFKIYAGYNCFCKFSVSVINKVTA